MTHNGQQLGPGNPPKGLRAAQRALWVATVAAYELEPHHLTVLEAALREFDRAERAEEKIAEEGEYITDRYGGTKAHPAITVAQSSRKTAAQLLRELGLDLEDDTARLPRSRDYLPYDRR